MSITHNRLTFLFRRYYNGEATEEEIDELMKLVSGSKDDEQLSKLTKEAWDNLSPEKEVLSEEAKNRILNSIVAFREEDRPDGEGTPKMLRIHSWWGWGKYLAAAVALIICLFGGWWQWNSERMQTERAVGGIQSDIKPGTNRAVLTLADGSVIQLDDAADGVISQQGGAEISKVEDGRILYKDTGAEEVKGLVNIVSTPRGGQYQIGLPDGSRVWLNASSSIKFPADFAADERRVEIEGEVFFEIEKEPGRPFRVVFDGNEVEVLGTSFNITNYHDEAVSRTTLVEGAVRLKNGDGESRLTPGQGATITKEGAVSIGEVDVEQVIAWKNGLFYFQDADIEMIMRQVSRWYDIEVSYEGIVSKRQFDGKVPRSVSLSELIGMLEYAGLSYRMEGRKMVIVQ